MMTSEKTVLCELAQRLKQEGFADVRFYIERTERVGVGVLDGKRDSATRAKESAYFVEAGKDGSALTVIDVVPDDFLLDEDCERRDETARLRRLVDGLSGRQRQVVLLRYGLGGQPPMTQQEVADLLGISRSYISRIEKAAVLSLRQSLLEQEK